MFLAGSFPLHGRSRGSSFRSSATSETRWSVQSDVTGGHGRFCFRAGQWSISPIDHTRFCRQGTRHSEICAGKNRTFCRSMMGHATRNRERTGRGEVEDRATGSDRRKEDTHASHSFHHGLVTLSCMCRQRFSSSSGIVGREHLRQIRNYNTPNKAGRIQKWIQMTFDLVDSYWSKAITYLSSHNATVRERCATDNYII
jgi:hypothetical protein